MIQIYTWPHGTRDNERKHEECEKLNKDNENYILEAFRFPITKT